MGAYSTRTIRVPVPTQYPVWVRLVKWSTGASELTTNKPTSQQFSCTPSSDLKDLFQQHHYLELSFQEEK